MSIDKVERGQKGAALVAHMEVPSGVIIRELYQKSSNTNKAFFGMLVLGVLGTIVYVNT